MKQWTGISTTALVWLAASVSHGQTSPTKLWDVVQAGNQTGEFFINTTFGAQTTLEGEPARRLTFSAAWARYGQTFTTPANWANYDAYSFIVKNNSTTIADLGVRWYRNASLTDFLVNNFRVQPGETVRIVVDTSDWVSQASAMRMRLPIMDAYYKHTFTDRSADLPQVYQWQIYSRVSTPTDLTITSFNGYELPTTYTNCVDEFGQLTTRNWPGKAYDRNSLLAQQSNEQMDLAQNPGTGESHGSRDLPLQQATGKWRVARSPKGFWYFVSPIGKVFWSFGLTKIDSNTPTVVEGRESMFLNLPSESGSKAEAWGRASVQGQQKKTYDFYKSNLIEKHGSNWYEDWQDRSVTRLRSWGFNTLGTGHDSHITAKADMPFNLTVTTNEFPNRISLPYAWGRTIPDVYDANFRTWFEDKWRGHLEWYSRNPHFMGVYVDGELPWGLRGGSTREKYQLPIAAFAKNNTSPSKIGYVQGLIAKYKTVQAMNQVYGTTFVNWAQVSNTPVQLSDQQLANPEIVNDLSTFLFNFSSRYYAAVKAGLRNVNCSALYLGGQNLLWTTPEEVLRGMERSVDVASFTMYDQAHLVPWSVFNKITRPILLSEFSFMSREGNASVGCFNENVVVKNNAERASMALAYLKSALSKKNCVGVHWFNYVDQPISGRIDGENYAFGLVDVTDRPHQEVVNALRTFSSTLYSSRGY